MNNGLENQLHLQLQQVARRLRRFRLSCWLAVCWLAAAIVAGTVLVLVWNGAWPAFLWLAPAVGATAGLAALCTAYRVGKNTADVARKIEARYPDLNARLLAAVEQQGGVGGRLGFLQESLLREALTHAGLHRWIDAVSNRRLWATVVAQSAAFGLLLAGLAGLAVCKGPVSNFDDQVAATAASPVRDYKIVVEPGDVELERGGSLLILARFPRDVPDEVKLVSRSGDAAPQSSPMTKSLDDPDFAARIPAVHADAAYHVEFPNGSSRQFKATVFDYPRLERADAAVTFPDYTGQPPKLIEDTRSVTAVEGSSLELAFHLNKPVREAALIGHDGERIDLAAGEKSGHYSAQFKLTKDRRFFLKLRDAEGRENKQPPELAVRVVPNRRPEFKLTFPARDLRVSPLEEVTLNAQVWDDFGISRCGLAYQTAGEEPREVLLGKEIAAKSRSDLEHLLAMEDLAAQPDQLISYHFWAEDSGPDGQPRRTASDMYFAEVRHFDEIFRQGQQPPGGASSQSGGGAQAADELVKLQKQIVTGTWRLIRQEKFDGKDAGTLRDSQSSALEQLQKVAAKLTDVKSKSFVPAIKTHMTAAKDHLAQAAKDASVEPLQPALAEEQAAYQALLKLRAREHRVTRGKGGGGGGGKSRSQQQLEQLDLAKNENRYETRRTAPPRKELAGRETKQALNRLRELARRQSDLNQRLKEAQLALQQAGDERRREEIRRRLKRLREEQQRMLRDVDELGNRMDRPENQTEMAGSRRQLEQARRNVRRASDALQQGMVSQALGAGTRATRQLQTMRDQFRQRAAGQFGQQMKRMREDARQLAKEQRSLSQQLDQLNARRSRTLRDSDKRKPLEQGLVRQRQKLDGLLDRMRRTVEEAEASEPLLARQVYDAVRRVNQKGVGESLDDARQRLAAGRTDDAAKSGRRAGQGIDQLERDVEKAAGGVLGDERQALRRARQELGELAKQVRGEAAGGSGGSGGGLTETMRRMNDNSGPLTGNGFREWSDRMRDVEEMIDDPKLRSRVAGIRERARHTRAQFRRHSRPPNWTMVEETIAQPLAELRDRVAEELLRRESKDSLAPIDRDPVPPQFTEQVRRYYESLGRGGKRKE